MFRDFRPYQNNYNESATTRATRHVKFTMELSFLKFFTKARARQKKSYIPPPSEVSHLIARHCSLARSLTLLVSISTRGWLARVSRGSSSCLRLSTERRKTLSRMGKLGGRSPSPRLPVFRQRRNVDSDVNTIFLLFLLSSLSSKRRRHACGGVISHVEG